jgi:fumarate hydratase class II
MKKTARFRIETDSMGEVRVPVAALYGAQTQRAVENFPISGLRFPRELIRALGAIKWAGAETNMRLGVLDRTRGRAISKAAGEVVQGRWDEQFVVDVFQTGSGTSLNMNANEVIANRAIQLLGGEPGSRDPVHPNDHVNLAQSSNDVIPSAIHIAAMESMSGNLAPALGRLRRALARKAREFDGVVKVGRTHLQDATPVRLGQEFGGYARQVQLGLGRLESVENTLRELPLGGTAVGTGINADPRFPAGVIRRVSTFTGVKFREARNHFEAQGARDAIVEASGALKTIATSLMKIANDVRWLGSGPRCGIGEIILPETQPGSSIMPGKVNPVIAESVCQAAAQVMGNDLTILIGGQSGNFELNVMMPVMAHNLLESIRILARSADNFTNRCVAGIRASADRSREMVEKSLALCTVLAPEIGYDAAAAIAKEAHETGRTVREVATRKAVLSPDRLDELLDPMGMTRPPVVDPDERRRG